jgi:hypothetical protein
VKLSIMQGPLAGEAIAAVESTGACPGYSPAIPPSHGGSQVFIYHQKVRPRWWRGGDEEPADARTGQPQGPQWPLCTRPTPAALPVSNPCAPPQAVEDFRRDVIAPFFVRYAKKQGKALDAGAFNAKLKSLQATQLAATLKYLEPANALPIWPVTIETTDN